MFWFCSVTLCHTWLSPSSWTSAELLSQLARRAETSWDGTCWTLSDNTTKVRTPWKTTEERWQSCDAASLTSPKRETLWAGQIVSWEKLCEVQKRRESGKRFSGGKVSRQKGEKYNVQRCHGHCVCVYMLFFSVWNDSVKKRSRGWLCWRRTLHLLRRRWRSCGAASEKLKGHDSKLDENSRSYAGRSVAPPPSRCDIQKEALLSIWTQSDHVVMLCFTWLQLKVLDVEKEQKGREVAELQTRLALEEQREEERGKEAFTLKQKLTEAETARDSLKKEVRMEEWKDLSRLAFLTMSKLFTLLFFHVAFYGSEAPGGVRVRLEGLWERTDRSAAGGAWLWEKAAGWSQEPCPARSGSSGLCCSVQPAAERGPRPTGRHGGRAQPGRGWEEGPRVSPEQHSVGADPNTGHRSRWQRRPGKEPRGELHIPRHYVTPPEHLTAALVAVAS